MTKMIERFIAEPKLFWIWACFIGVFLWVIIGEIMTYFDRGYWKKGSSPDPNAEITNVSRKRVLWIRNGAKYKTTVDFSDGYRYITHKTGREDGVFQYKIYVDKDLDSGIRADATYKHDKSAEKKLKKAASRKD